MSLSRICALPLIIAAATAASPGSASAATAWQGFTDQSTALGTQNYPFTGSNAAAETSNENYYDGDFGDVDGDGRPDRALNSRYGLLFNTGLGVMTPARPQLGFFGVEYDGTQWADIDNDGDLDNFMGDNGLPLTININAGGRFSQRQLAGQALIMVNTDVNGDGFVDIVAAHAFCSDGPCGGVVAFRLWVNDGRGGFTEQAAARGLNIHNNGNFIVGAVSGDVDGDGDFDLLIARGNADPTLTGVNVFKNNGAGTFTLASITDMTIPGSGFNQAMNLGDVDGDGDLDLVMAREGAGTNPDVYHGIAMNDGSGNFTDATASRFNKGAATAVLRGGNGKLVDIDYDGDLDFIAHGRASGINHLQVFINNASGVFTYDAAHSLTIPGATSGLGADLDITDLDGDGSYDVWMGVAGERVHTLINAWNDPSGLPADQPRNLRVLSTTGGGVTIAWNAPPFAANARSYKVYRSTAPGLASRDRRVLTWVTKSRHQDECFAAPITRFTTTAYLGDPDVQLVGASNEIRYTDRTAAPGTTYFYTVSHVGTENTESVQAPEVSAAVAATGGGDATSPTLEIVAPNGDAWSAYPRIVLLYGDGGSGIDLPTLRVSFNQPLGALASGADLSGLFQRKDAGCFVSAPLSALVAPVGSLVVMSASIADLAGNVTTRQVTFALTGSTAQPPTASFTMSATTGAAPLSIDVDASASTDTAPGKVMRWEWSFGDGRTETGRIARHSYTAAGTYTVLLVVRDNLGAIASTTRTVTVTTGSSTDTTPPIISGVGASGISATAATISWTTNEAADTQVEYGTTTGYGSTTTLATSLVTSHAQSLSGLSANTLYHFRVKSRDAAGNLATSGDVTFTTSATPDTTPPTISGVGASGITATAATISWTTNEATDTQVEYGTTTGYGSTTTLATSLVTSHAQSLSGLSANTLYHFRVKSRDASGNLATGADRTFTTLVPTSPVTPVAVQGDGGKPRCGLGTGLSLVLTALVMVRLRSRR
ncbi:MAG: VCBS repeat-containing protein [Planctomycetes bacterium]|nr:VCBS repeat-containing protein [Planctomycetota bacterium]